MHSHLHRSTLLTPGGVSAMLTPKALWENTAEPRLWTRGHCIAIATVENYARSDWFPAMLASGYVNTTSTIFVVYMGEI